MHSRKVNARQRAEMEEQREKLRALEKQRLENEASRAKAASMLARDLNSDDEHGGSQYRPPSKRKMGTPSTARVAGASVKRHGAERVSAALMWEEDGPFGPDPQALESLTARSAREQTQPVPQVPYHFAEQLLRDGLVACLDGHEYTVDGTSEDKWKRCGAWCEFVGSIQLSKGKQVTIISDGGYGTVKLGQGTFNVVVEMSAGHLPRWVPECAALRFTRPWRDEHGNYRYQNIQMASRECANAMFASSTRIGCEVYSVVGYVAPRDGRTLRYGVAFTMQKAVYDMRGQMCAAATERDGAAIAQTSVDLIYRASKCGVLFLDIKPGNILVFGHDAPYQRLTDYDPSFFLVTQGRDWKALFLCNLALLAAHVYNADFKSAGTGFLRCVAPLLRQMVRMRSAMDAEWLFCTRSVSVEVLNPKDHSDFALQRTFAQMSMCYFYGADVDAPSRQWTWDKSQQVELDQHWRTPSCRCSWPPRWSKPARPLVAQLVDMALSKLY